MDAVDGTDVRELIQKWRLLNVGLEEKNRKIEEVRSSLNTLNTDYTQSVEKWEGEKSSIDNTIRSILGEVSSKRTELQRMEQEATELERVVNDRVRRNEQHNSILLKKKKEVDMKLEKAETKDAGFKAQLELFYENRESLRHNLQKSINNLKERYEADARKHENSMSDILKEATLTKELIESESATFTLEQTTKCYSSKNECRQLLFEELKAATTGKESWSDILQKINRASNEKSVENLIDLESVLR